MKKRAARKQSRKLLRKVLLALFVVVVGLTLFLGAVAYRVARTGAVPESVVPSNFLLSFEEFLWESEQGTLLEAWFIPGKKGSPGILLAPGYELSRSDTLSLAARLNERGFHSLVFRRSGTAAWLRRLSSFGLKDEDEIFSALDLMLARPGVDRTQAGVWGVDVKARGALVAAGRRPEIKAVVADSAFDAADNLFLLRLRQGPLPDNAFVQSGCRWMLALALGASVNDFFSRISIEGLAKCPVLFIQGENRAEIGRLTVPVYERLQADKEMVLLPLARVRMMKAEEMQAYDKQVVRFFDKRLPVPEDPEGAAAKAGPGKQASKRVGGKK